MANYDDYLKELKRVADNAKTEHILKFENETKQLNSELSKLEYEMKPRYEELTKLRQENDNLSKELKYNSLVQSKKNIASGDLYGYQELARKFWEISNYKDSAKLADECEEQYLALKNRREEEEDAEKQRQKDRDEKARKLLEELKPQEEKQQLTFGEKTLIEFLPLFFGLFGGIIGLLKGEGIGYAIFCAIVFAIIGAVFSAIVKKIYF